MKKLLCIMLAAALVIGSVSLWQFQAQRIARLESTVAEMHRSALRQSTEELDALALYMEKALLTADAARAVTLLHHISQSASAVQQSLARVDAPENALLSAQVFAHGLAERAARLLPQMLHQEQLSADDRLWLQQQLSLCSQLASQLAFASDPADLAHLHLDVPMPAQAQQPRGLPQGMITQEEALAIARSFVGEARVRSVQAAPGTSGALAAFGVTVQTEDLQLNLEVTQQGGQVLWMMPETAAFSPVQSLEACLAAAEDCLSLHGFPPMEMVYHQAYDGLCVITLVPTQDGVLLYPDLLRVQVRMDTAQVVGLEAHSYWLNHTIRTLPAPVLTGDEASAPLRSHGEVTGCRLCVIPHEGSEVLCYECAITWQGESYLVYMDAQTGDEVDSLKYVPVENGMLVA